MMLDGRQALRTFLDDIARRRATLARRRAWTLGAAIAAAALFATAAGLWLAAPRELSLVVVVALGVAVAAAAVIVALRGARTAATPLQIARLVEEKHGGLDDVVVTAVDYAARDGHDPRVADRLARSAVAATADLGADVVVDRQALTQSGRWAAAAALLLVAGLALMWRPFTEATDIALAYLLPSRIDIAVEPGDTRVRAGQAVTVRARVRGVDGMAPALIAGDDRQAAPLAMSRQDDGSYLATIDDVTASFVYRVVAGARRSNDYSVTVVHPPVVERIALEYHYPRALGLPVRVEDEGGDIYAPAGTEVRFAVTLDRPVEASALVLATGPRVPLATSGRTLTGALTIGADDAYRISLVDDDGTDTPDDTEYFIRMLLDRPPDVRVVRPAGDRQVTPLEEVLIEARADDDFGVSALDLVLQKPGDPEVVVPLPGPRDGLTASGSYLLFLEDLEVAPGDFVTYFVRARDVGRGKPPAEARSDIFFLEVKAFDDEFVAAQSQAMSGGAQSQGVQDLAAAQKEIVVATWKLDARGKRARTAQSATDVRAIAAAQRALEQRAAREAGSQLQSGAGADPRRRRGRAAANDIGDDPMGLAIAAMRKAAGELDALRTEAAMPHELEALNQLLRAESDVRRRQVARQQGGGGGGNRNSPDLSSLFDQELRKQQQTNYETQASTETRRDERADEDPLSRLRELARRQEAMSREQRDLARNRDELDAETVKRRLERLSREQETLRRELEELARQMPERGADQRQAANQPSESSSGRQQGERGEQDQSGQRDQSGQQGGQSASGQSRAGQQAQDTGGQSGAAGGSNRQALRDAAEQMRQAASGLQQQDPTRASQSAERALERLRQAEQGLRGATAADRRRQLGDLQLEARQLADAERRLADELQHAAGSAAGSDVRRRAAADQERLAGRAERLQQQLRELAGQAQPGSEREAVGGAARELDGQRIAERMREAARGVRDGRGAGETSTSTTTTKREGQQQPAGAGEPRTERADTGTGAGREGVEIARALDGVASRLEAARQGDRSNAQRLSEELSRAQELRDRLAAVERSLERLSAEGQRRAAGRERGGESPRGQRQEAEGRQASGGEGATAADVARLQRELAEQLRETRERAEALARDNPELRGPATPEQWQPSVSAPGTEAFKQDFARWESLKSNLLSALEKVEHNLSSQLREQQTKDRLSAGASESVPDDYRALVEKYYRSLAAPRRPER